jgi:hypothetical protein
VGRAGLIAAVLAACAVSLVPGASGQSTGPPCAPGAPTPKFTVNGKVAPVHATHDLLVRVKQPGDPDFLVVSFDVAGVRLLAEQDEAPQGVLRAIGDAPGTLTANATLETIDPAGNPCTVSGSATFEVRPAATPTVSKLRRPPVYKPDPKLSWDSQFRFTVKPGPTGDRRPITVEARGIPRAKVPGPRVKAGTRTFVMRPSDATGDGTEDRVLGTCGSSTLVCPKKIASWPTGPEINVFDRGGRVVPAAVEVRVTLPRGYPASRRSLRVLRSPAGVDVKVLQGGRAIARLRIAGRCDASGQYSRCRYKTLTTAL